MISIVNEQPVLPQPPLPSQPIQPTLSSSPTKPDDPNNNSNRIKILIIGLIALVIIIIGFIIYRHHYLNKPADASNKTTTSHKTITSTSTTQVATNLVPLSINPINPTAIPLGDGKLSTTPEIGYVDSCITTFPSTGGATTDGPWINQTNKTWNINSKIAVEGSVSWPSASYSVTVSGNNRIITGNDLPINHTTGTFPISKSDPAYSYDQNPNTIKAQTISWTLPADPTTANSPSCTSGGAVGILNDGVLLFNALDGEGRDAGAHEILDSYQGHPDMGGMYHHHVVPTYMLGTSSDKSSSTLIGYAADGYGIYVERDADGNLLTNSNLDACHGRTSEVMWNGKMTDIYHYDATLEYPYTIGCFRGSPIKTNVS
jgi:hypothetical protein